jgi:hypothetical protein
MTEGLRLYLLYIVVFIIWNNKSRTSPIKW